MKMRSLLALAVLSAAAPALAASGEVSGVGLGVDRIAACEAARLDAKGKAAVDAMGQGGLGPVRIVRAHDCTCTEDKMLARSNPQIAWKCQIRVVYSND